MKKSLCFKCLCAFLLFLCPLVEAIETAVPKASQENSANYQKDPVKTGYEVDGRTSASVLAAKRSHAVSSKDETIIFVVSGGIAIFAIYFLVGLLREN